MVTKFSYETCIHKDAQSNKLFFSFVLHVYILFWHKLKKPNNITVWKSAFFLILERLCIKSN